MGHYQVGRREVSYPTTQFHNRRVEIGQRVRHYFVSSTCRRDSSDCEASTEPAILTLATLHELDQMEQPHASSTEGAAGPSVLRLNVGRRDVRLQALITAACS